jgi:hypothetical protein
VDDALSFLGVRPEEGFYGVRREGEVGVNGRLRCFAWCAVGEEDSIFARELFEGDWYEAPDTAYDEDLVVLVRVTFNRHSLIMHHRSGIRVGLKPPISVEGSSGVRLEIRRIAKERVERLNRFKKMIR